MPRGVEARGSLWTPGVPRALGSFPGDADLPSKTTAHPAPQRNRAAELCRSTLLGRWKSESVMEACRPDILGVMPALVAGIHVFLSHARRGWPGQARP